MRNLIIYILILFLFTGCVNVQKENNIDTNKINEPTNLQIGFGLQNIETGYSYDENEVTVNFTYELNGRDSKLGLMIYINGIPQMLKGNNNEGLVYKIDGKKDSKITDTVTFIPNNGKAGEILSMQGALIADCEVVDDLLSMTNQQHIIVCGKTSLKLEQDSSEIVQEDNKDVTYVPINNELIEKYKDRNNYFNDNLLINFPSNSKGSFKKGENIALEIVGAPAIYRVWILEDLIPIQSYYVDLASGQMALMDITLKNENTKNIKVFAVPLNANLPAESLLSLVRE